MSLRSNVGPAIVCLLLLVFGGAMAWLTGRSYVADLRSYYRQELTTVTLDAIRVTPRQVSLEVRMETFIDVLLKARRADGAQLELSTTFVGKTPAHADDINYLAENKGKQVQLWIDPINPTGFAVRREFPLYRAGPLLVWLMFAVLGAWGLYRSAKS